MPVFVNCGMIASSGPLMLHRKLMLSPAIVTPMPMPMPMPRLLNLVIDLLVARLVSLVVVRWRGRLPSTTVWCHIVASRLLRMMMVIIIVIVSVLLLLLMLLD